MEIILNKISKNFGGKKVINEFSFKFKRKSYAIIGKNGAGKSTLLKIIGNLLLPTSGSINYNIKKNISIHKNLFFAAPYQELISELSVENFLKFHSKFKKLNSDYIKMLSTYNLNEYINTKIGNLSSGSLQKLKLLIAFDSDSKFILLDEPTTNLDDEGKKIYKKLFRENDKKKGIIIATNESDDIIEKITEIIKI
jgi:ABC-type multidrug transport system ATPase subunit